MNVKLTKVQEAVLISLLLSYNQISKEYSKVDDVELNNLIKRVLKAEKKILSKPFLTKKEDALLAEKYFNRLKKLDSELFEDKDFSSLIMVIIILNYLIMHHRVTKLRVELGDIDTMKYICMLDKDNNNKRTSWYHMDVFETFLKEIGIEHQPN